MKLGLGFAVVWLCSVGAVGTGAAAENVLDKLLDRLPANSDLVLVADLGQVGRTLNETLDKIQNTPVVAESPELKKLIVQQRAMMETQLAALKVDLGFDPLKDLGQIALGLTLTESAEPGLVAVVGGKFPDGLVTKLAEEGEPRPVGEHQAYPLEDGMWVAQLDGLLVVASEANIEPALVGSGGAAAIKQRHPGLGVGLGEDFLLAVAFSMPEWLRGLAGQDDLRAVSTLLRSLSRVEMQVADDLVIGIACDDAAGTERAELLLKGYREMLVGGAHLWRGYALLVLGFDLAVVPGLPPQVQAALANREAVRKTIDQLLPSPGPKGKPVVARKGNRVEINAPPAMVQGSAFVMGIMAAVAIPSFIEYIRKSKQSEVYEQLDRCYKGTVDYYDRPRGRPDGTTVANELPASMDAPVCPTGRSLQTLNGESAFFAPEVFAAGGPAEVMRSVGWVVSDSTYACYQLTVDAPGAAPSDGQGFACHAWTDIDDDGEPAHYIKRGTYSSAAGAFRGGFVQRDPTSGEY